MYEEKFMNNKYTKCCTKCEGTDENPASNKLRRDIYCRLS